MILRKSTFETFVHNNGHIIKDVPRFIYLRKGISLTKLGAIQQEGQLFSQSYYANPSIALRNILQTLNKIPFICFNNK